MKDKRISEKEFGLNLNLDDSLKVLSFGDSRYILNCWSGVNREGNIGAVENEKGNTKITFTLPSGFNTCVGSAQDQQTNSIVFCIYNSNGSHGVYRYSIEEGSVKVILIDGKLGFERSGRDGYIASSNVVDGKFYWCTGLGEAGKLNLEYAEEWTDNGNSPVPDGGYQEINRQALTAIKAPPSFAPKYSFFTDKNRQTNFVADRSFQFAFRFVYEDYEKSVFSPLSAVNYPPFNYAQADDLFIAARNVDFFTQPLDTTDFFAAGRTSYNAINLIVTLGDRNVRYVEIAVKDFSLDVWNIFETLDNRALLSTTSSPTGPYLNPKQEYIVKFYNEKTGATISDEEIIKSQDYFPINPKHQEYTHLNLLTYGNYKEGYDLEPIDVSVNLKHHEFTPYVYGIGDPYGQAALPPAGSAYRSMEWYVPLISSLVEGDIIQFIGLDVYFKECPVAYYVVTDADVTRTQSEFEDEVIIALKNQRLPVIIAYSLPQYIANDPTRKLLYFVQKETDRNFVAAIRLQQINYLQFPEVMFNKPTLKSGAYHGWAIIYYDEFGRHASAQSNKNTFQKYVPMWGELGQTPSKQSNGYYHTAELFINHKPPAWAHYYQIVYTGAIKIIDFVQFSYRVGYDTDGIEEPGTISWRAWNRWKIKHKKVSKNYSFEQGDFVREIKRASEERLNYYGFEIDELSTDHRASRVTEVNLETLSERVTSLGGIKNLVENSILPNNRSTSTIEQFRYAPETEEQIYREVGLAFPIINPGETNRYHGGDRNQSATESARIDFDRGDAWTRLRSFENVQSWADLTIPELRQTPIGAGGETWNDRLYFPIIEDPEYSDYFSSRVRDGWGRPFGENIEYKRTNEPNGITRTNTYLQGTRTNGLNTIDAGNTAYVNIRNGEITGLYEVGFTLKVLQEHKVSSIYLGRQTTTNPQGTQDLILSDSVFSAINPSELDYGCSHPESVIKHDRHIYFFDASFGSVIRDSANGMEVISDYKASSLFKALGEEVVKNTPNSSFCRGGWNDETQSYIFTYMNHIPNLGGGDGNQGAESEGPASVIPMDSFTVSFHEATNRWKSFHSFIPEHMESLGREFVSFLGGELWRHNVNNLRCNYYGVQYSSIITPISNREADMVKVFRAISLHTNKAPSEILITIPPNELFPEGMYSRLQGSNLRWIEGNLYSALKKDLNTPGMIGASDIKKLNNGREMRGNVCEFRIIFNVTSQVIVTRLIVELDHSLMSG